jgi:polar amino acid transport system ATP-binding protein
MQVETERALASALRDDILRMRDIHKAFDTKVVLDGVDLDVKAGEKVALIGPSGSGKTTILRMAIGLTKPDRGTIQIEDKYLWHEMRDGKLAPSGEKNARLARRPIGMVFQQFNLFPHMTALENVREPIVQVLNLPRAEADERAIELLRQVGLSEHREKRPGQLSGGQQQRVAIARSLGLRPKVMLFDEVTSALDPELVGEVLKVLRDLAHATDMAMLLVTHEINFAADIADRVLMFDAGKIIEDGPPAQVLRNPQRPRTKQFLRAVNDR